MWDIVGKACGQPVYNLIGGKCREKIRVYANGWSYKILSPDDFARAAEATVKQGYTALKFDPLPRPWRTFIPREHEAHAEKVVKAVRDAVGPDVDLLIELHRRLSVSHAVAVADRIAPYHPFLIEEPCQAENVEAIAEVRQKTHIPVMTGENIFGKAGFRRVFDYRAADYLNADVANCGGILELREIAAMAEPYFIGMSPHNYNSTSLGLAATVHASAGMPNFIITEYFLPFVEFCDKLFPGGQQFKPINGYIDLPTKPGLGLEPDEKALLEHAAKPFPLRSLPYPCDERMEWWWATARCGGRPVSLRVPYAHLMKSLLRWEEHPKTVGTADSSAGNHCYPWKGVCQPYKQKGGVCGRFPKNQTTTEEEHACR